jgi:hypothetical protein
VTGELKIFVINGRGTDAAELAAKLRGGPVFDILEQRYATYGLRLARSKPSKNDATQTDATLPTAAHPLQIALVDLDFIVDHPDRWEELKRCTLTIVDVHFPLGSIRGIQAIQPGRNEGTRDPGADAIARDRWENPARLNRARFILYGADAVVSPRREWADLLEDWLTDPTAMVPEGARFIEVQGGMSKVTSAVRVDVLTDVNSAGTGGRFLGQLMSVVNRAMNRRYRSLIPWWKRPIVPIVKLFAWRARAGTAQLMTSDLIEAGVDFAYAQVPDA